MIKRMRAYFDELVQEGVEKKNKKLIKIDPAIKHSKVTHLPDRGFAFAQEPGNAPLITERLSVKIIKDPKLESLAEFTKKRKNSSKTANIVPKNG